MKKDHKTAKKHLDFIFKTLATKDGGDECIIQGYANTSTKDRVGDVVLPSAFEKSLPMFMTNPIMLENHNWDKVAGKFLEAKIDDKGLLVKGRISDSRPDLKTMVREGCISMMSIGYNEVTADFDEASQTKVVKELELLEISIVSIPANPEAKFIVMDVAKEEVADVAKEEPAPVALPKSLSTQVSEDKELTSFIDTVKEASGVDELDFESLVSVTNFYIENGVKEMKLNRKQLIEALKGAVKSAKAASEEVKEDPAMLPSEESAPDSMKEVLAKLDLIAKGIADLLAVGQEEPAEQSSESPAVEPVVEPAKSAEEPSEIKDLKDMTDEELLEHEAFVNSALSALPESDED